MLQCEQLVRERFPQAYCERAPDGTFLVWAVPRDAPHRGLLGYALTETAAWERAATLYAPKGDA